VLTFDPAHPFIVNQNQSFRLDFDMDLEASTIVDASSCTSGSTSCAPLVYSNPVLQFTTTPQDSGLLRARGLLVVVQPSMNNFIMNMHPFNDELYALGAMTVNVTPQTYYNINGQVVTGNPGLSLLQAIPISGNVLVFGTLDDLTNVGITPSMTATTVIGGTSLENYLQGHIQGVVANNTGSALTIAGATYVPNAFLLSEGQQGAIACFTQFFDTLPITVDGTTQVTQDGVAGPALTLASIPVGQQVDIAGQPITSDGTLIGDCTPPGSLDATLANATAAFPTQPLNGLVRLQTNTAQGTLISSSAGTTTISLLQLGPFAPLNPPYMLDSTTNPAAYAIDTGSLNLVNAAGQAATAGTVLTFTGNPATPGTAPPNFHASAVAPNPTELIVEWFPSPTVGGNPHPFAEVTATVNASPGPNLTIDKTNISRNVLKTGPTITDLGTLPAFPVIATKDGTTTFTVGNTSDGLFQYNDIASFEKEISTIMAASSSSSVLAFAKLVAQGQCSDANCSTFNATRVTLVAQ
jgi:hypothetical protein